MISSSTKFIFVHGFLGLPSDWQAIQNHLRDHYQNPFESVNLWSFAAQGATLSQLSAKVAQLCEPGSLVIGYSLGGRVLLHLPGECLSKIAGMILISSHFGWCGEPSPTSDSSEERAVAAEKRVRLEQDLIWSQRFQSEAWDDVLKSWNDQPIFKNDHNRPQRLEKDFNRKLLAEVIDKASLARQEGKINSGQIPWNKTLFLYGERDSKYSDLIKKWQTIQPKMAVAALPSGHYPLVNSARTIAGHVSTFYRKIMSTDISQ